MSTVKPKFFIVGAPKCGKLTFPHINDSSAIYVERNYSMAISSRVPP